MSKKKKAFALFLMLCVFFFAQLLLGSALSSSKVFVLEGEYKNSTVRLKWNAMDGALSYRVFREENDVFKEIADIRALSFIDSRVASNKMYRYVVVMISMDNKSGVSSNTLDVATIPELAQPVLETPELETNQVVLNWTEVPFAQWYRVLRRTDDGQFENIVDGLQGTSYADRDIKEGKTYGYRIVALTGNLTSPQSLTKSVDIPSSQEKPVFTKAAAFEDGAVHLAWKTKSRAQGYILLRSVNQGEFSVLNTVYDNVYVDYELSGNNLYNYRVVAVWANSLQSLPSETISITVVTALQAPIVRMEEYQPEKNAIILAWDEVPYAQSYLVQISRDLKNWSNPSSHSDNRYEVPYDAHNTYAYRVAAIHQDSQSPYSESVIFKAGEIPGIVSKEISYLPAPTLLKAEHRNGEVNLLWSSVPGATEYLVSCLLEGSEVRRWTTTGTALTDFPVLANKTYHYQVSAGKSGSYSFPSQPLEVQVDLFLTPPVVTAKWIANRGMNLEWAPIPGAKDYLVRRFLGAGAADGEWVTESPAFLDNAIPGPEDNLRYEVIARADQMPDVSSGYILVQHPDSKGKFSAYTVEVGEDSEKGRYIFVFFDSEKPILPLQLYQSENPGAYRGWLLGLPGQYQKFTSEKLQPGVYQYKIAQGNRLPLAFSDPLTVILQDITDAKPLTLSLNHTNAKPTLIWSAKGAEAFRLYRNGVVIGIYQGFDEAIEQRITDFDVIPGKQYAYQVEGFSQGKVVLRSHGIVYQVPE